MKVNLDAFAAALKKSHAILPFEQIVLLASYFPNPSAAMLFADTVSSHIENCDIIIQDGSGNEISRSVNGSTLAL